jgi:hypothetical protein
VDNSSSEHGVITISSQWWIPEVNMSTAARAKPVDFAEWTLLSVLTVRQLPKLGKCAVVYALRDEEQRSILKFGNTGSLVRRIFGNYLGGVGGGTTQRIHAELFTNHMIERVEIAWIEVSDKVEAEQQEKEFRAEYRRTHGQLPPWDRMN